ncbi:MAG: hypothetical protein BJBARM5_0263 [Candidatus Parvarchaeum acidophilus ARMAN-5]|jgi:hypothetical protein|uniref:Transmembrane protein n=1 Tax=Candidatus Parvarchaeum acidophilus ARMAN-5 TaxID=662762 RepID=D6GUW5_PARA5|nr:MAG: hypothetical protein BJBARM5_0263 [Candidatus Parvarchaeum acidophilus ARMAN-5]
MDKGYYAVLIVLVALVIGAALFYTNPYENHRQVAIGICELSCHNLIINNTINSNTCIKENASFGYSCAAVSSPSASVCSNSNEINLNYKCGLSSVN